MIQNFNILVIMSMLNLSENQDSSVIDSNEIYLGRVNEMSAEYYFIPAGSISSKSNRNEETVEKDENIISSPINSTGKRIPSHFIEYTEYESIHEKFSDSARFQTHSLCSSPDIVEESDKKLSKTQQVPMLRLRSAELYEFDKNEFHARIDSDKDKRMLRAYCENYEKQNRMLRKEVRECNKEIERLSKFNEKLQGKIGKYKEKYCVKDKILGKLTEAVKEFVCCDIEVPVDEHSCNFIVGQIQLQKSRMARKQSLYSKMKSTCMLLVTENKELKRSAEDLSAKNSSLINNIQKKRETASESQKGSHRHSESGNVSKSGTPVNDDTNLLNTKSKKSRTLSAKDQLFEDIDCYREALRDLKYLSERANIKIDETRKVLGSIPKPNTRPSLKPAAYTEIAYRPSGYFNYNKE